MRPRHWARRHLLAITAPVVLLLAGFVVVERPFELCGEGLTRTEDVCVGLDRESGGFQDDDPLADLHQVIAERNAAAGPDARTIVLLENFTPAPDEDSTPLSFVRHEVQGAITAAWPDGGPNEVRLLLASFGSHTAHWREAVRAIEDAVTEERIVGVTGVGISTTDTRDAVAELSAHDIPVVGATVTANDVGRAADGKPLRNFFRVAPTNTDEARAAADYVLRRKLRKVLVVEDTNEADGYATTLANSFRERAGAAVQYTKRFDSLKGKLSGASRDTYLQQVFRGMHSDLCSAAPQAIYFAGRGVDLRSLIVALSRDGACPGLRSVTTLAGDDVGTIVDEPLPLSGDIAVRPLFTALASPDVWSLLPGDESGRVYRQNYADVLRSFTEVHGYRVTDLSDGSAMVSHDAVRVVASAAEKDPSADPRSMTNFLGNIDCDSAIPGAGGFVAFGQDHNQIDHAVPIMQVSATGGLRPVDLVWPQGHPLDTSPSCTR